MLRSRRDAKRKKQHIVVVSSESCSAASHDLALADKLGIEFRAVEGEVDVEVYTVECALRSVHAFEVFL